MARKILDSDISFDDISSRLLFTAVALELAAEEDDQEVAALAAPLNKLLDRWEELDGEHKSQKRATIRSNALCKQRNMQLDSALTAVHNATLAGLDLDREAPLFTHLFPRPLSTLTRPALEGQIPIVAAFIGRLKDGQVPAALRKAHDKPLKDRLAQGEAARDGRIATVAAAAGLKSRVDALWEDANAGLQHVEGALKQIAAKRRLSKDWVDSFFPDPPSRAKKPPAEPSAAPAPA